MIARLLAVALLVGCGALRSYNPTPLAEERDVDRRTIRAVGDTSVAFALRYVGSYDGAPMMTLWLRNGGVEPVAIDVTRLHVQGFSAGASRALQLQDPRGELEPLHLDAGASGREKLRLADLAKEGGALTRICIDPSKMFVEQEASLPSICFVPGPEAAWEVVQ